MINFLKNLFKKKSKDEFTITVTVNGENVSDLDNETLSEMFKELSNKFKPGKNNLEN
jgi:hypothetical protein